jgi:hypothetical protein
MKSRVLFVTRQMQMRMNKEEDGAFDIGLGILLTTLHLREMN